MMASTRMQLLSLYKQLLRESNKLPDYNFRTYAIRRVRDAFREKNQENIEKLTSKAQENLEIIRRQVIIGRLYGQGKLVIEK